MLNLDRNNCNILFQQTDVDSFYDEPMHDYCGCTSCKGRKLIPIDHGLSIPDTLAVCSFELAWLSEGLSKAEVPFSAQSLAYIEALDI